MAYPRSRLNNRTYRCSFPVFEEVYNVRALTYRPEIYSLSHLLSCYKAFTLLYLALNL